MTIRCALKESVQWWIVDLDIPTGGADVTVMECGYDCDCSIDDRDELYEALMADEETPKTEQPEKKPHSPDDILFEPIEPPKKDEPVPTPPTDDGYCYDN